MKTKPTVSIITPMHNAGDWITQCLNSVANQTLDDFEHIIINDRSQDNGPDIAALRADMDDRVFLIDSPMPGAGSARNAGIEKAQGRYIAFLDADDMWDANKLEIQIAQMQQRKLAFSWTSYRVWNQDSMSSVMPVRHASTFMTRHDHLTKKYPIGCLTAVYDTAVFGKVFMKPIKKRQDFVLWSDLFKIAEEKTYPVGGITDVLATYNQRSESLSGDKSSAALAQWNALYKHCDLSFFQAASCFAQYSLRGLWTSYIEKQQMKRA